MTSGETRESQQQMTMTSGRCPVSASAWYLLRASGSRVTTNES
jgi:hypothetical protein